MICGSQEWVVRDSVEAVSAMDPSWWSSSDKTPGERGCPPRGILISGEFQGLVPKILFLRLRLLIHSDQDALPVAATSGCMCCRVLLTGGFNPKRQKGGAPGSQVGVKGEQGS